MKEIIARSVLSAAAHIERLDLLLQEWESPKDRSATGMTTELPSKQRRGVAGTYREIARAAEAINAPVTKIAAERAKSQLLARNKPITLSDLKQINAEVRSRLQDEVGGVRFYCLGSTAAGFYNPREPLFGATVEARLPKAANDISEAGKCFAVDRYTAAVFHLMRALEAALQSVGTLLGLTNVDIAWGPLLSAIHGKIEAMPKGATRDDWSQIQANLYHVKQVWRNDTMHPKATYTEEEAREVFDATKAFMRNLAEIMPITIEELVG